MTKLDELIQELCPTGVAYKNLNEVCNISAGGDVPKDTFSKEKTDEYIVPIISNGIGQNSFYGYTNTAKINVPAVTIAARGTIGYAEYRDYPYFPIIRLLSAFPKDSHKLNAKYLYYCLQGKSYSVPQGGIPQLTMPEVKKVKIPVPPLPVQREIVRILDNFTELTAELTAELIAELIARKQQYAYYRDKLLTHSSETKICKLADVCESIADGDHMPPPKADDGIPFITISNITEHNKIDFSNSMFVPSSYYDALADKRKPHSGDILYTVVGSYGIPVCIEQDTKFVFQRHIAILRPRSEVIKARYMFHAMQGSAFKAQADKAAKGAAQKTIGLSSLAEMTLPVPNMCIQERLIRVLDNFDSICTDLNIGLPAEIEARRKQYEFYRDQLLTFAAQGETILTDRQTDRQTSVAP